MANIIKRGMDFRDVDIDTRMRWLEAQKFFVDYEYWGNTSLEYVSDDCMKANRIEIRKIAETWVERPKKAMMIRLSRLMHYLHETEEFERLATIKAPSTYDFVNRYGATSGAICLKVNGERLAARPAPTNVVSQWSTEYWINKGMTMDDAVAKVRELQQANSAKREDHVMRDKVKCCIDYWVTRGYTREEGEVERMKYVRETMTNDLAGMILRHGEVEGTRLYHERCENFVKGIEKIGGFKTLLNFLGTSSSESLTVMQPVHDWVLSEGIANPCDIYGIDNRERYIAKKGHKVRFYDYTIESLKVIIEFHGTAWHPRMDTPELYRAHKLQTGLSFDDALGRDIEKRQRAIDAGYDYLEVWSDVPLETNIQLCKDFINDKYQSQNGTR